MIDCHVSDADAAADFWAIALGRLGDDPRSRANYRMLETPRDEQAVEFQRAEHERRVHIDIETDDIAAGVARLEKLAEKATDLPARWGHAGARRSTLLRCPRAAP